MGVLAATHIEVAGLTALMCMEGLVGGWVTPGVKLPILSEIVAPAERDTTMALLASLEGSLGSMIGPPLVGFLAEHTFGYRAVENTHAHGHGLPGLEKNRQALRSALLCCTMLPWLMQAFVFFPLLHVTYAADVRAVKARTAGSSSTEAYELANLRPQDDTAITMGESA